MADVDEVFQSKDIQAVSVTTIQIQRLVRMNKPQIMWEPGAVSHPVPQLWLPVLLILHIKL